MRLIFAILIAGLTLTAYSGAANAQTFTITVQITEGSLQGPALSGVNVNLVMNGSTQFNAQTDSNGTCVFPGISGSYDVTPSKVNYSFTPNTQGGTNTGSRTLFFVGSPSQPTSSVQFNAFGYPVAEGNGSVTLTLGRTGDTSNPASVSYATSDTAGLTNCNVFNGVASSRCDYPVVIGTISFAPGETSKTISIPIIDDSYAEGNESFSVNLSNPVGTQLSLPSGTTVTINDNETSNGPNPIDQTAFFVRQHYIDFLGREPDPAGFAAWQNLINNCPAGDTTCDRIHVSGNFFQSPEFQQRGYFVYRFYPVAFGRKPQYAEFIPDLARVRGFLSDAQLEAAKVAFINDFMARTAFANTYNGLSNTQYVDTLLATAGITHIARDFWIAALGDGTRTRAQVLREIAESSEVYDKYYNQAFVVMQYFGYLRREPDASYLDWIQVLNTTGDSRGMINGFVNSLEYRFRFGP
jgi:hypothetical protein